jgi:hypothetical protein
LGRRRGYPFPPQGHAQSPAWITRTIATARSCARVDALASLSDCRQTGVAALAG